MAAKLQRQGLPCALSAVSIHKILVPYYRFAFLKPQILTLHKQELKHAFMQFQNQQSDLLHCDAISFLATPAIPCNAHAVFL